jgi:hypothetical protein
MYNGKQIKIYYHCFLTEDKTWVFTLLDQMELMVSSGLIDVVDEIRTFVGGTEGEINTFKEIISYYPKVKIIQEKIVSTTSEDINNKNIRGVDLKRDFVEIETMNRCWLDCQNEDFYFLYLQFKSITSFTINLVRHYNPQNFRKEILQKKFLEWGNIEKWKTCVEALETHNMAGCTLRPNVVISHREYIKFVFPKSYRGNIWWSKSSYIKTLKNLMTDSGWWEEMASAFSSHQRMPDRWMGEFWPLTGEERIETFFNIKDDRIDILYEW